MVRAADGFFSLPDHKQKCVMNTTPQNHPLVKNSTLCHLPQPIELPRQANHREPRQYGMITHTYGVRAEEWEALTINAEYRPEQMAALCHITLRHLERLFHQQFDKTPTVWIREFRCRRVIEMLAGGYSNKWIAFELRFSNPSHLCHEFKKVYGTSPRAFMRSQSE